MQYYPSNNDENWNIEVEAIMPYIPTKSETDPPERKLNVIDIGCGDRTINDQIVTVDIDNTRNPNIVAECDKLPMGDNTLDGIVSIHSFEHFKDQRKVLTHWVSKLKKGGIIAMVHPDRKWTHQKEVKGYEGKRKEFYKHEHERTLEEFVEWFEKENIDNLEMIAKGSALGNYSFFVIFKVIK